MPARPSATSSPTGFSHRLEWGRGENALAAAESVRRRAGQPIWDLTDANPTTVGLNFEGDAAALTSLFGSVATVGYAPDARGLVTAREAVAAHYARLAADASAAISASINLPVDGLNGSPDRRLDRLPDRLLDRVIDRLILTASSSESYSYLWKLLCDPGDTVLVPEPSYPLFEYLARLEGVRTTPYRLSHDGTRADLWRVDLDSVDVALANASSRVAALVIVSPNNPTGSVLKSAELDALDQRAAAGGFALIADEVFADFIHRPDPAHVTFVAAQPTEALTFSLGGLSKSCGLPHLKLGWMVVGGPAAAAEEALGRLSLIADTYLSVGTPVQVMLPDLLRIGAARRRTIADRIAHNRRCLLTAFGVGSPLSVLTCEGGWSAVVRLPAVRDDEEWALTFLEQDGVLVHPGYFFDFRDATVVVLSLLPAPGVFEAALQKLAGRVAQVLL